MSELFKVKGDRLKIAAYSLICLALAFGFFSRLVAVFRYITFFYPDQVRDAEVYMSMWQGKLPTLGPGASVGGYKLLPLYYYLVFPSTILGVDPVFQVLPNALLSFLSIPLLMYFVYQLLEKTENSKRLFLAALAGFWYSLLFVEIFINTYHWNPGPIPFFMLCFLLLYKWQLEAKLPHSAQVGLWILYGIVLAILVSLHSTTLFVMPVAFIASCILFISRNRKNPKKCLLPLLSVAAAIVSLAPYWRGELSRNWTNTKGILTKITSASAEAGNRNILERIGKAFQTFIELAQQAYFLGFSGWRTAISIAFFSLLLVLAFLTYKKYKGNSTITLFLAFTWLVYLYAASNFWGLSVIHNKFIILFAPILITVVALDSLDFSSLLNKIAIAILTLLILLSIILNLNFNTKLFASKYGADRAISTADIVEIFEQIPAKSTVCDLKAEEKWQLFNISYSYKYLDKYISKRDLKFVKNCQPGNYALQPKNEIIQAIEISWPMFTRLKNEQLKENYRLFLKTPAAYVYVVE
ncbi:hypothetical protein Ple7327_4045 [Pleurocapsa sp. PCC 7327]|uniref:hypothetical protein n=1 Tax=Pleurocapsa sp. PCC 7327 TaxID=118163 RepID=UPI00029FF85A|nr:hypothetical protein [Pleurocapsa sp. PCC 7327]AFY79186.1 hypothetical protein Ple7327_4045 [Pleurocapsa sp. PCC 7327]